MKLTAFSRQQLQVCLLLAQGYNARQVESRIGTNGTKIAQNIVQRLALQLCPPEQEDGRSPNRIVTVWAARNYENLQAALRAMNELEARELRALPPAVTEARLGVA